MEKTKSYTIISTLFLLLFLSFTPPLLHYPNETLPGTNELLDNLYNNSDEMKELTGIKNKSKSDVKAELLRELRVNYIKHLLLTSWGLLGGILLLLKKRTGRYLVLALSIFMVGKWLYQNLLTENPWEHLYAKFTMFFKAYPTEVIHYDIVANIIYLAAIVFLLRPSASKEFKN